jgi:Tlde1 domain
MSTSTCAFGLAAPNRRKSPRRIIPQYFLGSAAIAGLVLGCAWTVYSNVLGAGIYPAMNSAAVQGHVIKHPVVAAAARPEPRATDNSMMAALSDPAAQSSRAETLPSSIMFNERFAAAAPQGVASRAAEVPRLAEASPPEVTPNTIQAAKPAEAPKLAEATKLAEAPKVAETPRKSKEAAPKAQVALNVPAQPSPKAEKHKPRTPGVSLRDMAQRAKAAVMSIASNEKPSIVEKLWGKQPSHGSMLSYASADASITGSLPDTKAQDPMLGGSPPYDRQTAVYDITAHMVYLPDGTRLEAHSGLGSRLDDPRYANVRMRGVTPPHIYELTPREALFHGVPALRLTPIGGEDKIFGRDGLLAHTYMLGPNGESNGCVSFKDYYAFLRAYRTQGIRRLAVLARIK